MKKILLFISCVLFVDVAYATTPKFSITTINMSAGDVFNFSMSAAGTFTVDCGDGGTLSGTGVSGNIIDRTSNTTYAEYACTYSTDGIKTIGFDGTATGYNSNPGQSYQHAPIAFFQNSYVASVSGDLSAIFPSLGSSYSQYPRFMYTFAYSTNLTSMSQTLFSGYTSSGESMFWCTFFGCTNLETIPYGLFDNITTGAESMFSGTFAYCTGLTSLPSGLFQHITTGATSLFESTFEACTNLQNIPGNLFSNLTSGADRMFWGTFARTALTHIPENLFSSITTGADYMFYAMFMNDTALNGYIPKSTFAGLVTNGSPIVSHMWDSAFYNTNLMTSCPSETIQFITGYESEWGSVVSCEPYGIASTSYVQGMYEAINNSKMAKLNPNSIEFTPDSTPYGFFTAVEGAGDKFRFKREEITLPFGSYDNPTGRMSIWLE